MAPGDTYLHLPSNIYGFESWDEPLLTLWAERVVDPGRVPRLLSELQVMATDQVTSALQRAAHLWLQSEDPAVELFLRPKKQLAVDLERHQIGDLLEFLDLSPFWIPMYIT